MEHEFEYTVEEWGAYCATLIDDAAEKLGRRLDDEANWTVAEANKEYSDVCAGIISLHKQGLAMRSARVNP